MYTQKEKDGMAMKNDAIDKFTQLKYRNDGSVKKHKEISEKKFDRVSKRYAKQDGSKSLGTSDSKVQQVVSGRNSNNSVSRSQKEVPQKNGKQVVSALGDAKGPSAMEIANESANKAYLDAKNRLKSEKKK